MACVKLAEDFFSRLAFQIMEEHNSYKIRIHQFQLLKGHNISSIPEFPKKVVLKLDLTSLGIWIIDYEINQPAQLSLRELAVEKRKFFYFLY